MASAKTSFLVVLVALLSVSVSGGLLDYVFPTIFAELYQFAPIKNGYRFNLEEPNGSKRDEMGVIMNPGTPDEQLVVMGTYSIYDEKTDTDYITMYIADKNGFKPRYIIKKRGLSAKALKSSVGSG